MIAGARLRRRDDDEDHHTYIYIYIFGVRTRPRPISRKCHFRDSTFPESNNTESSFNKGSATIYRGYAPPPPPSHLSDPSPRPIVHSSIPPPLPFLPFTAYTHPIRPIRRCPNFFPRDPLSPVFSTYTTAPYFILLSLFLTIVILLRVIRFDLYDLFRPRTWR